MKEAVPLFFLINVLSFKQYSLFDIFFILDRVMFGPPTVL